MRRFVLPFILALLITFPIEAGAVNASASDLTTLNDALLAVKSSSDINSTILISDTIVIKSPYTIKGNGKNITLKRAPGFLGDIISVEKGASITLEDVTIDGNGEKVKSARGALINNAGLANLRGGVILKNNKRINSALGAANGGAVTNTGIFTMKGGEITNNSAQTGGGGIFNFGGTVSLSGVKIAGNSSRLGGGITNADNGKLTITGNSIISGNTAYQGGGAMNAGENARLTLSGNSIITGNTADYGTGVMNASEMKLSGKIQIGKDGQDNGLYMGLYQLTANPNKASISSASMQSGSYVNLEGGINHEGDGLIMIVGRSQRSGMQYFHCDNPHYELTVTQRGSLVLKQRAVTVVNGEGYEKKFLIEARLRDFVSATLNYKLTNGVHYTVSESGGILTITLRGDIYLKNLGDGPRFIRFDFVDGKAECIFENGSAQ